jgi:hypothetical protein
LNKFGRYVMATHAQWQNALTSLYIDFSTNTRHPQFNPCQRHVHFCQKLQWKVLLTNQHLQQEVLLTFQELQRKVVLTLLQL